MKSTPVSYFAVRSAVERQPWIPVVVGAIGLPFCVADAAGKDALEEALDAAVPTGLEGGLLASPSAS